LHIANPTERLGMSDLERAVDSLRLLSKTMQAEANREDSGVVVAIAHQGLAQVAERLGFIRIKHRPGLLTPLGGLLVQKDRELLSKAGIPTGAPEIVYIPTATLHRIYGTTEQPALAQVLSLARTAKGEPHQLV
jgi:hypothetical protein